MTFSAMTVPTFRPFIFAAFVCITKTTLTRPYLISNRSWNLPLILSKLKKLSRWAMNPTMWKLSGFFCHSDFFVKSILVILDVQKLSFLWFLQWVMIFSRFHFSLMQNFTKIKFQRYWNYQISRFFDSTLTEIDFT